MAHVWFRDTLDHRRNLLTSIPHPLRPVLVAAPTLAQGQDADLKWETVHQGVRLRYWLSRLTVQDRPRTDNGGIEGMYPSIFVEACFDGNWVLVDGYQGHII